MENPNKNNIDIDILGSIEFDLSEAIKDLIWNIKALKIDVDNIKNQLQNKNEPKN